MAFYKQSTAYTRMFKMIDSADHFTKKTGLTCTVNISKAGAAFGAAAGTVTEVANGWYKVALTTADTNTVGDLAFYITASGADDTDFSDGVFARTLDDLAYPATSGRSIVVDAAGLVDANMVKAGPTGSGTAQTAKDIGGAVPAAAAGASGGLLISGSNAGTTTLGALTITGATTHTGNVVLSDGLTISAPSTTNRAGLDIAGNGTGAGIKSTGGATGAGISAIGGGTSGDAILTATTSGHGITAAGTGTTKHGINATGGSTTSHGISATGGGVGHGILATSGGGATGDGIKAVGASTNGNGLNLAGVGTGAGLLTTGGGTGIGLSAVGGGTSGDAIKAVTTSGHGLNLAPVGTSKHGIFATGGNGGTSDGISAVAGTGGVPIRGDITGNITGALSGAVGSVTGAVGSVTGAVGSVTGAVGSVTGNVGGNVTGSIGSLAAQAKADVNAEVDTALDTAIPGSPTANSVNERIQTMDNAYTATRGAYLDNLSAGAVALDSTVAKAATVATAANLATAQTAITAIKAVTDVIPNAGALTDLKADTAAILLDTGTDGVVVAAASKTGYRLSATGVADLLASALTESYAADGAAPTLSQAIFQIQQFLMERSISTTTMTVKKLDGTTSAMTLTLDDATSPTSITRAT